MPISFQCPNCGLKLKAPESAAGKSLACPRCETQVTCPEPIYDAEVVGSVDDAGPRAVAGDHPVDTPVADSRRPCPMCGEMIVATAARCRFCGEVFDPSLEKPKRKNYRPEDQYLSTGEIVVAVLCSMVGCIVGIVWIVEGRPKGAKMVAISLVMVVVWNVLFLMKQMINP